MTWRSLAVVTVVALVTVPAASGQCTWTPGTGLITYTCGTSVGIGMTSPVATLDVLRTTGDGGTILNVNGVASSTGYRLALQDNGTYRYRVAKSGASVIDAADNFSPALTVNQTLSGLGAVFMGGNVGIGTTAPTYPLQVVRPDAGYVGAFVGGSAANGDSGRVVLQTGAAQGAIELDVVNDDASPGSAYAQIQTGKSTNVSLRYFALDHRFWTGGAEALRVTTAGNLGVGTTVPIAKVDAANGSSANAVRLSADGSYYDRTWGITQVLTDGSFSYPINAFYTNHGNNSRSNELFRIHSGELGAAATAFRVTTGGAIAAPTQTALVVMAASGNIGIGTTAPSYRLDVSGAARIAGDLIATGSITGARVINAVYQDLAEWVPAAGELDAGTVVVLDPDRENGVTASSRSYDASVAGVVSATPGIVLGEAGPDKLRIATTGRVKVKVDALRAPIRIGDLLVTSDVPGMAMKSEPLNVGGHRFHQPGTILGKALEPLPKGEGEILVLLSLQ